jgi:peptide chain release factor 2
VGVLEHELSSPGVWNDPGQAKILNEELSRIKKEIAYFRELHAQLEEVRTAHELWLESGELDQELARDVEHGSIKLGNALEEFEFRFLLSGPHDRDSAILAIHPGAGGTESQDWAEMLLRMYLRWAEKNGHHTTILDLLPGEEAGVKSATVEISGEYIFGLLKSERGVHRLVRISPFDANKRRHTSFASVDVMPDIQDEIEIAIKDEDLRIDVFRSSGAGGQHVNKTESAVRITHLPTGIVVQCQEDRSQIKNRANAMKVLKARLYVRAQEEQAEKNKSLYGAKMEIAFGSQIRSYVMHPYNLVKDHRTNAETGDVQRVMDGDLALFIESYLKSQAT